MEKQPESFEKLLLSHVEMCYAVAFALTRDADHARKLTQETVTHGWHMFNRVQGENNIKGELLSVMRERFIEGEFQKECAPEGGTESLELI